MSLLLEAKKELSFDFLFWMRQYIDNKMFSVSDRFLKNDVDLKAISKDILNINDDYLSLRDITRELSCKGLKAIAPYSSALYRFYEYIKEDASLIRIKDITHSIVMSYISRDMKEYASATKQNHYTVLKNFFSYIEDHAEDAERDDGVFLFQIGKSRSGKTIPLKKSPKKPPQFLTTVEFERFLQEVDVYPFRNKRSDAQNRLILKILLYTGIRAHEVVSIKIDDLQYTPTTIRFKIKGKGDKERTVFAKKVHIEEDINHVKMINRLFDNDLLFCNPAGSKITERAIYSLVSRVLKSANIKKEKKGPHLLRHSYATYLLTKNVSIKKIQELLGHTSIQTSMIYTHLTVEELEKTTEVF